MASTKLGTRGLGNIWRLLGSLPFSVWLKDPAELFGFLVHNAWITYLKIALLVTWRRLQTSHGHQHAWWSNELPRRGDLLLVLWHIHVYTPCVCRGMNVMLLRSNFSHPSGIDELLALGFWRTFGRYCSETRWHHWVHHDCTVAIASRCQAGRA